MKSVTTLAVCCLMALSACMFQDEPNREEGVNVTVVPVRDDARPDGEPEAWVFRVTLPGGNPREVGRPDLATPLELIDLLRVQPQKVRDNGIWVLVNDENEVSDAVKSSLKELLRLADREEIPLFICRSSEFPYGWDRVN
jgi:hypothetical protein